ncbi:MAG: aspartate 1-decarboxylase [Legionella sp.]
MIYRRMLKSKIHRARVTQADLTYEGSITISPELLKLANILPFEAVHIWNVTRGTRFETYTIEGISGSEDICVNGAAAHLVNPGDIIIIASFVQLSDELCQSYKPIAVFVDDHNRMKEIRPETLPL